MGHKTMREIDAPGFSWDIGRNRVTNNFARKFRDNKVY